MIRRTTKLSARIEFWMANVPQIYYNTPMGMVGNMSGNPCGLPLAN